MSKWIDAHTHLDSDQLYSRLSEVLDRAFDAGVEKMLVVNSEATEESFSRTFECMRIAHATQRFASIGIHPHHASQFNKSSETRLGELLRQPGVIALGEIGLDYYYNFSPPETQRTALQKQLQMALDRNLPVVIHCRDAYPEIARIARELKADWRGMIHCFTGTPGEAEMLLALGFHISFSGIVTFRKAGALREAARIVPQDRILVETDAPYLAPVPFRGKTNEPAYVVETARLLAKERSETEEEFSRYTTRNFDTLFLSS